MTPVMHVPKQEVMGFQDLPFLPLTMRGHSRDGRQFPSHEEVPRVWLFVYLSLFYGG